MEPFIYRVRPDGLFVLDVKKTDDRIRTTAKFLSRYEKSKVAIAATRLYAHEPVKMFCKLTGATPLIGRFIPGQLSNPQYKNRVDPEVILVCDPRADAQAVKEASTVGIPNRCTLQHRQRIRRRRPSHPNQQQRPPRTRSHLLATSTTSAQRKRRTTQQTKTHQSQSKTSKQKSHAKRRRNPKSLAPLRRAVVASQFYEGSAEALRAQLNGCFLHKLGPQKTPTINNTTHPRDIVGLICPHAGYMYSGPVAAHAFYDLAQDGKPDTVVLLRTKPHRIWQRTYLLCVKAHGRRRLAT